MEDLQIGLYKGVIMDYEFKFYIRDSEHKWVDFSNRFVFGRTNSFKSISSLTFKLADIMLSDSVNFTLSDLKLQNHDYFFDTPSLWNSLVTVDGAIANFNKSSNSREINMLDTWCRFSAVKYNQDDISIFSLGNFIIHEFVTNGNGEVNFALKSISEPLTRLDASKVRDGNSWYVNKSITYLLEKILLLYFGEGNTLPNYFSLPDILTIPTYDGSRYVSSFGRPPEKIIGELYVPPEYYSYSNAFGQAFKVYIGS